FDCGTGLVGLKGGRDSSLRRWEGHGDGVGFVNRSVLLGSGGVPRAEDQAAMAWNVRGRAFKKAARVCHKAPTAAGSAVVACESALARSLSYLLSLWPIPKGQLVIGKLSGMRRCADALPDVIHLFFSNQKKRWSQKKDWSGRRDSNSRPLAPHAITALVSASDFRTSEPRFRPVISSVSRSRILLFRTLLRKCSE